MDRLSDLFVRCVFGSDFFLVKVCMGLSTWTQLLIKGCIVLLGKWSYVLIQPPFALHSFQWVELLLGTSVPRLEIRSTESSSLGIVGGGGVGERALPGTIFKTIYFFLHRISPPTLSLFRKWICWSYKNMGSIWDSLRCPQILAALVTFLLWQNTNSQSSLRSQNP